MADDEYRYAGRGFLYVLVATGPDDLLKVGLTHAPLPRWSAFHPRWFEAFDLDATLLVETETRADAQALETALHRRLVEHACPAPLTFRTAAGGETEWFRGAYDVARAFVDERERAGHVVHRDAYRVLAPAMREQATKLAGLIHEAHGLHASGWLAPAQRAAIRDLVDAHRAFGADLDALVPASVREDLGLYG
jgi:hypothetical protein